MARTEAQKKADKKYRNKKLTDGTKKQINITIYRSDYTLIDEHCKSANISKASFIVNACKYCIENNIDLTEYVNKENNSE